MHSPTIEFRGDDMDVDFEFEEKLKHKLNLFKKLVYDQLNDSCIALKLNQQEAYRIVCYAQDTYFKHLRLYEYVFNNRTASEIKRINFTQEEAKTPMPLTSAL